MATVAEKPPVSDTATDTLKAKTKDGSVISGGHLVAKALKAEGVDTIFTLCGGHIIDIYDGCLDEGIRIVDVRHEQTAAHAADGYARQTGKLGCVVTTAGPGCTNAVTGVATAFRSESPILHIGGQSSLTQHKMGSLQDLPHVDMMTPITKFASGVFSTERVADMVSMAARECFNGAYVIFSTARSRSRTRLSRRRDLTALRPNRSAIRPISNSWPTSWSRPSARRC
jgi:acetolactate synthase-1/2/3 large subunit